MCILTTVLQSLSTSPPSLTSWSNQPDPPIWLLLPPRTAPDPTFLALWEPMGHCKVLDASLVPVAPVGLPVLGMVGREGVGKQHRKKL